MSETRSDMFIKILKILESYKIEGEKCVKYPTPLARDLTDMIYDITNPIIEQAHGFTEADLERLRLAGITGDKDGTKFRALYDHIRIYKKYSGQSMDQTMGDVIKLTNVFVLKADTEPIIQK